MVGADCRGFVSGCQFPPEIAERQGLVLETPGRLAGWSTFSRPATDFLLDTTPHPHVNSLQSWAVGEGLASFLLQGLLLPLPGQIPWKWLWIVLPAYGN